MKELQNFNIALSLDEISQHSKRQFKSVVNVALQEKSKEYLLNLHNQHVPQLPIPAVLLSYHTVFHMFHMTDVPWNP